jgi:hypothetical protein
MTTPKDTKNQNNPRSTPFLQPPSARGNSLEAERIIALLLPEATQSGLSSK